MWGDDVILYNRCLQIRAHSIAVNFVQLFTLSGGQLEGLFSMFPSDRKRVRRAAVVLAFQRAAYLLGRNILHMENIHELKTTNHFDRTLRKNSLFKNEFKEPFSAKQLGLETDPNDSGQRKNSRNKANTSSKPKNHRSRHHESSSSPPSPGPLPAVIKKEFSLKSGGSSGNNLN